MIGISRVAAGIHTPFDIVGAIAIAAVAAAVTMPVAVRLTDRLRPTANAGDQPPADA